MILNLTQHESTPAQRADGVVDLTPPGLHALKGLLTVPSSELLGPSPRASLIFRANSLAGLAAEAFSLALAQAFDGSPSGEAAYADAATRPRRVMIGGLPALMAPLEEALRRRGLHPIYSVSDRVSRDVPQPDGTVAKASVFEHLGFVEAVGGLL